MEEPLPPSRLWADLTLIMPKYVHFTPAPGLASYRALRGYLPSFSQAAVAKMQT